MDMDLAIGIAGYVLIAVAAVRFGMAIVQPITRLVPVPRDRSPLDEARALSRARG